MAESRNTQMEKSYKIIRKSIYTFLQHYQYFTITIAFLALPYTVSLLLSQTFIPSSSSSFLFNTIYARILSIFNAAGFTFSTIFSLLILKFSQIISSSILCFPFTFTSLLITKCCIIQSFFHQSSSISSLYRPILITYIFNTLIILSVNTTSITLFILGSDFVKNQSFFTFTPNLLIFFSCLASFVYSVFLANAIVICNLALISSGVDKNGGFLSFFKACVMIEGKLSTALFLALPSNLVMAANEALFQYRVVQIYQLSEKLSPCLFFEGMLIAYLYSNFIVLDTIVSCNFFKSCCKTESLKLDDYSEGGIYHYCKIEVKEEEKNTPLMQSLKNSEEIP